MPNKINKVMIINATRNNTTVSNIILFVGDNVIRQGISFSCSSGCLCYMISTFLVGPICPPLIIS